MSEPKAVRRFWSPFTRDAASLLLLFALTLLFFWRIAFTGLVLAGYDAQTYFYPYRHAAARAILHGRLPLWDPNIFLGVPFMANIQTAVFYPLNVLFLLLPTPSAMSTSILLHVFMAGAFFFAFARSSIGVGRVAALVGAMTFMFSGFMGAQVAHLNQLNVASWLPLLLLCYDQAVRRRSSAWTAAGAAVVAIEFVAGHSQETYLILVCFGLYFLYHLLCPDGRPRSLRSHRPERVAAVVAFGLIVALGLSLTALQALPTLELAGESIRAGGLSYPDAVSFSLRPWQILPDLLPGFTHNPFTEFVGYVGVFAMALAIVGARQWRRRSIALFFLALVALGLFFAFGGFNPLWIWAYRLIPGFRLFRVPARWLYVYTVGAAGLATLGAEAVPLAFRRLPKNRPRLRQPLVALDVAWLLITAGMLLRRDPIAARWALLAFLATTLFLLARLTGHSRALPAVFAVLVATELFFASRGLDYNHPLPRAMYDDLRPTEAYLLADHSVFRTLSIAEDSYQPGDSAQLTRLFSHGLGPNSQRNFLIATKWKEVLTPNLSLAYGLDTLDGYDGGVLPLRRYVDLKQVYVPPCPGCDNPDAILRNQLHTMPDLRWLSLLNVKYIVTDKLRDAWVNGIYYDLSNEVTTAPAIPVVHLRGFRPVEADRMGIVTSLVGSPAVPQGAAVARVTIHATSGLATSFTLRAGIDTADARWNETVGHVQLTPIAAWPEDPQSSNYLSLHNLPAVAWVQSIDVTPLLASVPVRVQGVSLLDTVLQSSTAIAISQDGALQLVQSGDVKIYRNRAVAPRVFLVHRMTVVPNGAVALQQLPAIDPLPGHQALITYPTGETHHSLPFRVLNRLADTLDGAWPVPTAPPPAPSSDVPATPANGTAPDHATIVMNSPEQVHVRVKTGGNAYLVLSNGYYPGWSATLDGRPVPLYRADYLLMAVYVPAGTHTVQFSYRSRYFHVGLIVSALTAIAVILLAALNGECRRLFTEHISTRAPRSDGAA